MGTVAGQRLDLMIIVVSSKFNDSIFLLNVVSAFVNGKNAHIFLLATSFLNLDVVKHVLFKYC